MRTLFQHLVLLVLLGGTGSVAAQGAADMRVEVLLSDTQPFVQQTVILTVRVYHSLEVRKIEVDPVSPKGFTLGKLDDVPPVTRMIGHRQMITDFYYALMPLAAGTLRIPALKVRAEADNISMNANQDSIAAPQSISATSEPVIFEVRTVSAGSETLPLLYAHEIMVQTDSRQHVQVGQPIRLTIIQNAMGADGERLPAAATLIKNTDDFRIYPGQSRTTSRLGRNGKMMMHGQRIETVTLVPLRVGSLKVPPLRISWWSINRNSQAESEWPGMQIRVPPAPGTSNSASNAGPPTQDELSPRMLSLLPGILLAFIAGWWLRGRCTRQANGDPTPVLRLGRLAGRTRNWLVSGWHDRMIARAIEKTGQQREPKARVLSRINQFRTVRASTAQLAAHLPKPRLLWLKTGRLKKRIEAAHDERELRHYLQGYASEVLGIPAQSTFTELGKAMENAYSRCDVTRIRQLLSELGDSLYSGGKATLEIKAWKLAFIDELEHLGRHNSSREKDADHTGLPVLNPG
jgi:hypothetical protein